MEESVTERSERDASRSPNVLWDREKLDEWCQRGILGLVLAILVYSPLAFGSVRAREFLVVEWLTTAVLALWLGRFWLNPKHRLLWPPVCWGVVIFMGYAVGRYLVGVHYLQEIEYVARQETIKVLLYGFLFLAILHNLYHLEWIQLIGMVIIGLGTIIAMYALGQFLTESNHVWGVERPPIFGKRGSGTFYCPNHLAGYLEMLLPLALGFCLTSRLKHVGKILLGYAALAIFTGVVVSVSLGGWISTGVSLLIFFILLLRWRDYRLQGLLFGAGLLIISVFFILKAELSPNRMHHLNHAFQNDERTRLWTPALRMWQDYFWFGAGPGHFDHRFAQYRPVDDPYPYNYQWDPLRVHNDYINTLTDWGLVGAILVAVALGLFFWGVFKSWKYVQRAQNDLTAKRSNKATFVMGGALGIVALLVHSMVDFNMHIPSNAIVFITLMALVSGHFRYSTEGYWHTVHWPMRLVITVVLLGGLIYLGQQSWQHTRETYWLEKAKNTADSKQWQIAMEKALAVEPMNYQSAYLVGEGYRLQSWEGGDNYRPLAEKAMNYYTYSSVLNPYLPVNHVRYGMCLHWLGRHPEAQSHFDKAVALDPIGYYTAAHMGWHYVQLGEWAKSKEWFEKSMIFHSISNQIASTYLPIVKQRLWEMK